MEEIYAVIQYYETYEMLLNHQHSNYSIML